MPSMVEIGPVVLEKMKIRKVYRRTTGDQKCSRAFSLDELRGCHCIVSHYSCVIKDSEEKTFVYTEDQYGPSFKIRTSVRFSPLFLVC